MFSYHQFSYCQRLGDIPNLQSYITVHYSVFLFLFQFSTVLMLDMISIFIIFILTENLVHKYLQTLASSNNYLSNVQFPPMHCNGRLLNKKMGPVCLLKHSRQLVISSKKIRPSHCMCLCLDLQINIHSFLLGPPETERERERDRNRSEGRDKGHNLWSSVKNGISSADSACPPLYICLSGVVS